MKYMFQIIGTYASQYQSASRDFSSEGTFRVFNSSENKIISSQYLSMEFGLRYIIKLVKWTIEKEENRLQEETTNFQAGRILKIRWWESMSGFHFIPHMEQL